MIKNSVLLMTLIVVMACNHAVDKMSLFGVKWELQIMEGDTLKLLNEDDRIFLKFNNKENRVNGKATCNRFFGNYELDGSKLKFSTLGATRMACPDQNIEIKFFKLMEQVDNYSIEKGALFLKNSDEIVMVFKSTPTSSQKTEE